MTMPEYVIKTLDAALESYTPGIDRAVRFVTIDQVDMLAEFYLQNRRADLPPTLAQALALPEIAALVDAAHRVNHDNLHGNGLEGFRYGRERLSRALGAIDDAIAKVQP